MRIAGSGSVAWPSEALGRDEFVELVRREGARLHRDLPWRYIDDPYAVLVSEVMLQQTQVARVEKHWTRFLSLFPTIDSLAAVKKLVYEDRRITMDELLGYPLS